MTEHPGLQLLGAARSLDRIFLLCPCELRCRAALERLDAADLLGRAPRSSRSAGVRRQTGWRWANTRKWFRKGNGKNLVPTSEYKLT